jgi:hypothetical protein
MLVEIMTRRYFPALHVGTVWIYLVPPKRDGKVSHFIHRSMFELTHVFALFLRVYFLVHFVEQVLKDRVLVLGVVVDRAAEPVGTERTSSPPGG